MLVWTGEPVLRLPSALMLKNDQCTMIINVHQEYEKLVHNQKAEEKVAIKKSYHKAESLITLGHVTCGVRGISTAPEHRLGRGSKLSQA